MDVLHSDDGIPLHVRHWSCAGPARGTVLVVHGVGEHIGRYDQLAADLNRAGWHVLGYDQRGHGASGGARGRLAADDSLLRDLARVIDVARQRQAARGASAEPLVLLGHSMGGLVAARFVAAGLLPNATAPAWRREVQGLVLSSPALDAGMSAPQKLLLAVLGPLLPDFALGSGLKAHWISRDPVVVQAYESDPLVHDRVTPRLVRFIVDGGTMVRAAAPSWRVPTLLLYAGADRLVAPSGSQTFAAAAPASTVSATAFPQLFHEIFNEPERALVVAKLVDWLAHLAP